MFATSLLIGKFEQIHFFVQCLERTKEAMAWMEEGLQISLKTQALSMKDKKKKKQLYLLSTLREVRLPR